MTDPLDVPPADHGSDRHGYVEVQWVAGFGHPDPPPEVLAGATCEDCLPNLFLRWDGHRWHRTVAHDDSCPGLARLEAEE